MNEQVTSAALLRCSYCEAQKPAIEFHRNKNLARGYSYVCKVCSKSRSESRACTKRVMEKYCPTCKQILPASAFDRHSKRVTGLRNECRECAKWKRVKKLYGVSREQYTQMFMAQDGKCAICHRPSVEYLMVDHDHQTNKVRALLCRPCNLAIGNMGDDATRLKAAADYILKHQHKESTPCP